MNDIGVVIPCKNYGRFLRDALTSVFLQGLSLSVAVVNDAGEDAATVDEWVEATGAVVIHLPLSRGIGIARNVGAAYLDTEFLLFLDADDWLHPGAVDALYGALKDKRGADFAYGNYTQDGAPVETPRWNVRLLKTQNIASYCNVWRADAFWRLGGYRDVPVAEDWDLQRRAMDRGYVGAKVDALIFEHRQHGANKWDVDAIEYGGLSGVSTYLDTYKGAGTWQTP
jgi:glycosyltransferase involved in cell wall biosynthesis